MVSRFCLILITAICIQFALCQQISAQKNALQDQLSFFGKSSSTKINKDEDKDIVAIRHLNLIVNDIDNQGYSIKRKIPYVEIELFTKVSPPTTNSTHLVQIGDQEFYPTGKGCGEKYGCIMVVITPEQFKDIKDNALVTYRIGSPGNAKLLKEVYKNGEPAQIGGAKFGRIKKSMIDKFPTVERNNIELQ